MAVRLVCALLFAVLAAAGGCGGGSDWEDRGVLRDIQQGRAGGGADAGGAGSAAGGGVQATPVETRKAGDSGE